MINYNTLSQDIYTTKRSIYNFASKLSEGMQKPNKKFLMDMLFGLAKGKSVLLSDIALTLEESIDPIQTIKRLSSRLGEFHEEEDRKSTRLNSSHVAISYAVFCLIIKIRKTL